MQPNTQVEGIARRVILCTGLLGVALTIGFFWQLSWATRLWPWPDSHLSYVWLASICAAIAAPILWIALAGEFGAMAGGAVNLCVTAIGASVSIVFFYPARDQRAALALGVVFAVSVPILAALAWWSSRFAIRDPRPMPRPVFIAFIAIIGLLAFTSLGLLLRLPTIFPWALLPQTSVLFGWFFVGAACYFAYGLWRPTWQNTCGQLLGFLAYDVILIGPFLGHFAHVPPSHLLSLIVYVAVILASGALAIFYLFFNQVTRLINVAPVVTQEP